MDSIPSPLRRRTGFARGITAALGILALVAGQPASAAITLLDDGYHVHPGDEIQEAMQAAATNRVQKTVHVHAGEYRSRVRRQALVWFNRSHDGIHLVAEGAVTLTAANPELALPSEPGFPAVVNHVVYFGDGVSSNTVLQGFQLTGANAFLTRAQTREMEPSTAILKNFFFYSDGGGVKVFGRSYPVLRDLTLIDNFTRPCGAGISIQHQGYKEGVVRIENCVFRNNRAQGTGGALDLLVGSAAEVVNCLFVENTSNTGEDLVAKNSGERPFVNNGVVTLFWNSKALFQNCTRDHAGSYLLLHRRLCGAQQGAGAGGIFALFPLFQPDALASRQSALGPSGRALAGAGSGGLDLRLRASGKPPLRRHGPHQDPRHEPERCGCES